MYKLEVEYKPSSPEDQYPYYARIYRQTGSDWCLLDSDCDSTRDKTISNVVGRIKSKMSAEKTEQFSENLDDFLKNDTSLDQVFDNPIGKIDQLINNLHTNA